MTTPAVNSISRRTFVAAAAVAPIVLAACHLGDSAAPSAPVGTFTIRHAGEGVRCLYYDHLAAGDRADCLAIVLLHGAGTNATQWFDIGLVQAVDDIALGHGVRRIVAIAPDIVNHNDGKSLVLDSLLPAIDPRFAPGHVALSGISRGGAVALDVARSLGDQILSVGLHSPATRLDHTIGRESWPCWIDVGRDDSLAPQVRETAHYLSASGVAVSEHVWPGRHDRTYWRSHLPAYLGFHVDAARRSAS